MALLKIAAIQMQASVGEVGKNLAIAEALARQAFRQGANWVILPEFFPSAVAYCPAMLNAWMPLEGPALTLLRKLAREHDGVVGGSFIAKSGDDCFNSFLLVFPDGHYYRHDKDLPTMWENSYYIGGDDDGVLDAPDMPVGVAMCWELIRSQTPRRLLGKVNLVVGGSCWWDNRLPIAPRFADEQMQLRDMFRNAPSRLAKMLGVPVVHASHAGNFEGLTPGNESTPYPSRYLGETQIVDGHGKVLAHMSYEDGEGVVLAEVEPQQVKGSLTEIPDTFWLQSMPVGALKAWEYLNPIGKDYYQNVFRPSIQDK